MKCLNCGFEYNDGYSYCPNCGSAPVQAEAIPVSINPTEDKILAALKDKLFLVLCILISASCVLSVLSGSFPIIYILAAVFLWIIFAKSQNNIADTNMLRCLSGTVFAGYVVNYVIAGLLIFFGALVSVFFPFLLENTNLINSIYHEIADEMPQYTYMFNLNEFISFLLKLIGPIFIIIGLAVILINFFSMRKIHAFVKSVYQGIIFQIPYFNKPQAARNWTIFFAVCSGITALSQFLSSILGALSNGCNCALLIISAIIINKYFIPRDNHYSA